MPEDLLQVVDIAAAAQVVDRKPVAEIVEPEWPIDQAALDGAPHRGRELIGDPAVTVALVVPEHPSRMQVCRCADYCADSLHAFVKANAATGVTAKTDGWSGYPGMPEVTHEPHVIGSTAAHVILPWIHRVFSNLKTWALGVYHGLRRKHLQAYLDEFVFRFNRRRSRHAAFRRLLGFSVTMPPATYNMLIAPEAKG